MNSNSISPKREKISLSRDTQKKFSNEIVEIQAKKCYWWLYQGTVNKNYLLQASNRMLVNMLQ